MGSLIEKSRARSHEEAGFTLIELLVVLIIIGILAAITIPSFFNQKDKADDTKAKTQVRALATTIETCRTEDEDGDYGDCDIDRLRQIDSAIPAGADVPEHSGQNYVVQSAPAAGTGNLFRIRREDGQTTRACTIGPSGDHGGCQTAADDPDPGDVGTW